MWCIGGIFCCCWVLWRKSEDFCSDFFFSTVCPFRQSLQGVCNICVFMCMVHCCIAVASLAFVYLFVTSYGHNFHSASIKLYIIWIRKTSSKFIRGQSLGFCPCNVLLMGRSEHCNNKAVKILWWLIDQVTRLSGLCMASVEKCCNHFAATKTIQSPMHF